MPRFSWRRKQPGSLGSSLPGRKFRIAVFALVVIVCVAALAVTGPNADALIVIVLCAPAVALIVPELFELWEWMVGTAEARAVERPERIYRFGYTDIRMRMMGARPWFAAADVGGALGFDDVDRETRYFDVVHRDILGDELYLSEDGVEVLMGLSSHPDARSFRIWFEREVMFPLNRARGERAGDDLSRRSGA